MLNVDPCRGCMLSVVVVVSQLQYPVVLVQLRIREHWESSAVPWTRYTKRRTFIPRITIVARLTGSKTDITLSQSVYTAGRGHQ